MRSFTIIKFFLIILILLLVLSNEVFSAEKSGLVVTVEVIKAERGSKVVDPELKDLVEELGPVLNFTGFALLKKSMVRLKLDDEEELSLPAGRLLQLQIKGYEDNNARLSVKIVEKDEEIFRSTILMVDNGSAIIGGPPHKGGVLLLRISALFENKTK